MLQSGVGRAPDLKGVTNGVPWSIKHKVDRPVGLNLQNHPFSLHFVLLNATTEEISESKDETNNNILAALEYINNRKGPFTYMGSEPISLFANVFDNPVDPNGFPNIQWIFYQFKLKQLQLLNILDKFKLKSEYAQQLLRANQDYKLLMIENILLTPKSRGAVRLRDGVPTSDPKIYENHLTDEHGSDKKKLIEGIKLIMKFIETPAMKAVNAKLFRYDLAECDAHQCHSDDYWICYFKYFLQNCWHPSGTCKMGKESDACAVVDPKLKVIGITGVPRVRVADASIMPQITASNTQCPCYAIGEKAADLIIADNP